MAAMTRLSLTLNPMGILHFHLFFWNHRTNLNQTWHKCSLDGHIKDVCPWRWSEIQHGCKVPYYVMIGRNLKKIFLKPLSQLNCDFVGIIIGRSCTKLVNRLLIGNSRWPPWLDLILTSKLIEQTCHRWSLGGQLPKLRSVTTISVQNGRSQRT